MPRSSFLRFDAAARTALFIVYVWFGALKIFTCSPAASMVDGLMTSLFGAASASVLVALGVFEVILGILFVVPRFTKVAQALFALHLVAILLPLVVTPSLTWSAPFVPTLEGQYIIKNLLLAVLVAFLGKKK